MMMNAYAVYTFPETTELNNETIKTFVKTGHAQFLRWDFCDSIVSGLLPIDAEFTGKMQSIIYVYFTDDSLTPFHHPAEVDTLVRQHIPQEFVPSTFSKIDKLQIITLALLRPIIEHDNAPKERKKK